MVDVASAIRGALVDDATISAALPAYKGSEPVFTRRPVDPDSPRPMIIVSPDIAIGNEDMPAQKVPVVVRDVAIYGHNNTAAEYRAVETIAYRVRDLFHRNKSSLTVSGWKVIDVRADGPFAAPTDDLDEVARIVTLTIRLSPST